MKNFRITLAIAAAAAAMTASLSSCSKLDDNINDASYWGPNALVTIKTTESGTDYFQLDEKTTLEPEGWTNPYKREVRALLKYSKLSESSDLFSKKVAVVWIDSVRTKSAVPYDEEFKKGNNVAVALYNDWITCCEDGYLTLHFAAWFGRDGKVVHYMDLAVDPETHDLYLRHDDNGDNVNVALGEGVIAFKIDDLLADVKDGQELTLHWKASNGEQSAKVKYYSRFSLTKK